MTELEERLCNIALRIFNIGLQKSCQELKDLSIELADIAGSLQKWHTGTPSEEGWYLLKCSYLECPDYIYETKYFQFESELSENVIEWQKINYEEEEHGHTD